MCASAYVLRILPAFFLPQCVVWCVCVLGMMCHCVLCCWLGSAHTQRKEMTPHTRTHTHKEHVYVYVCVCARAPFLSSTPSIPPSLSPLCGMVCVSVPLSFLPLFFFPLCFSFHASFPPVRLPSSPRVSGVRVCECVWCVVSLSAFFCDSAELLHDVIPTLESRWCHVL